MVLDKHDVGIRPAFDDLLAPRKLQGSTLRINAPDLHQPVEFHGSILPKRRRRRGRISPSILGRRRTVGLSYRAGRPPVRGILPETCGLMPTDCVLGRRRANVLAIVTHRQEVRPMNAVSALGAPLQSTIARLS